MKCMKVTEKEYLKGNNVTNQQLIGQYQKMPVPGTKGNKDVECFLTDIVCMNC
jgi:hypothetical protein